MGSFVLDVESSGVDDLVTAAQGDPSDDSPAMSELLRRFEPLAQRISNSSTRSRDLRPDLANAARLGLVAAVRHHNGGIGFAAYVRKYMYGAARRELQSWSRDATWNNTTTVEERELAAGLDERRDSADAANGWGCLGSMMARLRPVHLALLTQRYVEDHPLRSIATMSGTTASAVSQRLNTAHRAVARLMAEHELALADVG